MINFDDQIKKMWKEKYKHLAFLLLMLVFAAIFFIIISNKTRNQYEQSLKRYKRIERLDSLTGKVSEIYCDRGASEISLTDGRELILPNSKNYDYENFLLCCFINGGDSIKKQEYSNTLHILRDGQEFHFVLGEKIGKRYYSRHYRSPCN